MVRTDISVFLWVAGATGDIVTLEKRIPRKKIKIKSLATSPPWKDPISNQDKNTLGLEKYQSLPPHIPPFPAGFKSLGKEADDDNP